MDLVTIRSRTRDWALQFTSAGVNKSVGTRTSPIDFSCRLSADMRHIRHPFSGGDHVGAIYRADRCRGLRRTVAASHKICISVETRNSSADRRGLQIAGSSRRAGFASLSLPCRPRPERWRLAGRVLLGHRPQTVLAQLTSPRRDPGGHSAQSNLTWRRATQAPTSIILPAIPAHQPVNWVARASR